MAVLLTAEGSWACKDTDLMMGGAGSWSHPPTDVSLPFLPLPGKLATHQSLKSAHRVFVSVKQSKVWEGGLAVIQALARLRQRNCQKEGQPGLQCKTVLKQKGGMDTGSQAHPACGPLLKQLFTVNVSRSFPCVPPQHAFPSLRLLTPSFSGIHTGLQASLQ